MYTAGTLSTLPRVYRSDTRPPNLLHNSRNSLRLKALGIDLRAIGLRDLTRVVFEQTGDGHGKFRHSGNCSRVNTVHGEVSVHPALANELVEPGSASVCSLKIVAAGRNSERKGDGSRATR